MWRDDVLAVAWQTVRRNGGTAGVDGETVADVESQGVDGWLGALARDLKEGTYRPQATGLGATTVGARAKPTSARARARRASGASAAA